MSDEAQPGVDRRQFLKVLGVTGAGAATLSGCSTDRVAKLVPYLGSLKTGYRCREWYALPHRCSTGCGVHVRRLRVVRSSSREPRHPATRGRCAAVARPGCGL